jgi:hypothetical protein
MMARKHEAGKGDTYRPVDQKKWSENWEMIFSKKTKNKNQKNNNERKANDTDNHK